MGRPITIHLSLNGLLRTPDAHQEAYQSMISAVPQTAENQPIKSSLGKFTTFDQTTMDGIPLPCYRTIIKEQVFSSFMYCLSHSAKRVLPKDANSVKMLAQTRLLDFGVMIV
ncbi:hypothetical protein J6590_037225 [Homalodisca vitripennis]|nr:hypothetical protein J6590_037225 [Homalodisca vitripennis]